MGFSNLIAVAIIITTEGAAAAEYQPCPACTSYRRVYGPLELEICPPKSTSPGAF